MHITAWQPMEDIPGAKMRIMTYVRPLAIPLPFTPNQCDVKEIEMVS